MLDHVLLSFSENCMKGRNSGKSIISDSETVLVSAPLVSKGMAQKFKGQSKDSPICLYSVYILENPSHEVQTLRSFLLQTDTEKAQACFQ